MRYAIALCLLAGCGSLPQYSGPPQVAKMDYECPPKGDGDTWKRKPYAIKPAFVEWYYLPQANVANLCGPKQTYASNSVGTVSLFGCAVPEWRDGTGSVLMIYATVPLERASPYNVHHEYCHWEYSH